MPPRDRAPRSPSEQKRARILDAALRVCERSGVEAARMEEVAALARVSKGTLYHFFESKRDLFLATLIDSYEEALRISDAGPDRGEDPREHLARTLDGLSKVLTAIAPRMNVHYQAWGLVAGDREFQERLFGFLRDFFAERSRELVATIRDGQIRGVFAAEADPIAVTDGIVALLSGFLYRSTFDPAFAEPERLRASYRSLVGAALAVDPWSRERRTAGRRPDG